VLWITAFLALEQGQADRSENLRGVQLLLGHLKVESTVRYLGIEVDDARTQILLKHKTCLTM